MASTADDVHPITDHLSQDSSSQGVARTITPSKAVSSPHEHPQFNFQPVEMTDLSNSKEGSQPDASTSHANPTSIDTRKENVAPSTSADANMPSKSPDVPSKPLDQLTSSPSQSSASNQVPPTGSLHNTPNLPMPPQPTHHRDLQRSETIPAIGAASENPHSEVEAADVTSTMLMITLLLHTGARHPFKLDDRYLKKRNVTVADDNPINMSVYTLKELIWRDWRQEWDPRPASPSSIRLIHYGKLLEDKNHLRGELMFLRFAWLFDAHLTGPTSEGRFANGDTPHVVHMTVKPQDVIDDEDARIAKGAGRSGEDGERRSGCRCVIL